MIVALWPCLGAFIVPCVWLFSASYPSLSRRPERRGRLTIGAITLAVLFLAFDFGLIMRGGRIFPTFKVYALAADSVIVGTLLVGRSVARLAPIALIIVSWIAALLTNLTAGRLHDWLTWGRLFR